MKHRKGWSKDTFATSVFWLGAVQLLSLGSSNFHYLSEVPRNSSNLFSLPSQAPAHRLGARSGCHSLPIPIASVPTCRSAAPLQWLWPHRAVALTGITPSTAVSVSTACSLAWLPPIPAAASCRGCACLQQPAQACRMGALAGSQCTALWRAPPVPPAAMLAGSGCKDSSSGVKGSLWTPSPEGLRDRQTSPISFWLPRVPLLLLKTCGIVKLHGELVTEQLTAAVQVWAK